MSDPIDRQAAIDLLKQMRKDGDMIPWEGKDVFARIRKLPSAQPEQWIPCSERLPELDEAVLATTAWNDITIAWRIGISEWFIHEGNTNAETADVLAWKPLDEPYKGEQE